MNATASSLGRAAVVGATVLVASTLLAGVVGGMWRLVFAGLTRDVHAVEAEVGHAAAVGFELGFGLPLVEVLALASLIALPVAAGYFVYDYATCGHCRRSDSSASPRP
ncbi:MAG: hypothetical protein ABEJ22_00715 [Haloferacaceae archaeon]